MSTSFCGIPSSISHSTVSNRLFEAAARSSPTSMLTSEPSGKYLLTLLWLKPRDSCELGLLALGR